MRYLSNVTSLKFYPDNCSGCGRCIDVCPHGVFAMNGKKAQVLDSDLCMECGACANNCEFEAIKVRAGVGCAAAVINSIIKGGEPSCDCGGSAETCCG